MQFMFCNLVDRLNEEHEKFMWTLIKGKNFLEEHNVSKFRDEVQRFNELNAILGHLDFPDR